MTDGGKGGFGDFVAVVAPEFAVVAQVVGQDDIGGLLEGEHLGEHGGGVGELGGGHGFVWGGG